MLPMSRTIQRSSPKTASVKVKIFLRRPATASDRRGSPVVEAFFEGVGQSRRRSRASTARSPQATRQEPSEPPLESDWIPTDPGSPLAIADEAVAKAQAEREQLRNWKRERGCWNLCAPRQPSFNLYHCKSSAPNVSDGAGLVESLSLQTKARRSSLGHEDFSLVKSTLWNTEGVSSIMLSLVDARRCQTPMCGTRRGRIIFRSRRYGAKCMWVLR